MKRRDVFRTLAGAAGAAAVGTSAVPATAGGIEAAAPKAVTPTIRFTGPGASARHAMLELNGQNVSRFARRVAFDVEPGSVCVASVELYAHEGFEFVSSSMITCAVVPFPERDVLQQPQPDGTTRWTSVPKDLQQASALALAAWLEHKADCNKRRYLGRCSCGLDVALARCYGVRRS